MHGGNEVQNRFRLGLEQTISRAIEQCDYAPESYRRMVSEHGAVEAARRLLAKPVSDDSLQLWARGRPDLTIEAMARSEQWRELFSATEREAAGQRYGDWIAAPLADEVVSEVLAGIDHPLYGADEIAWGE
jgi:hypothetical protein